MHTDSKWEMGHLYVKLLLCLKTMVWRHVDGVDVNLCTFLARAFYGGLSYCVPGNVIIPNWIGIWMAAESVWTEWR